MTSPSERIQALTRAGKLDPAEAQRLLAVLETPSSHAASKSHLLVNPFDRFGGGIAAICGLIVAIIGITVSTQLGQLFDGFIDQHGPGSVTLRAAVVHQVAAWIVPSILFWVGSMVLTRRGRFIDFVGMVGLSRAPLTLESPIVALIDRHWPLSPNHPQLSFSVVVILMLILPCLAWTVTLQYQGFKNASGLRGAKLIGSFVALVVVSEVLSKILIHRAA
ncbi:MAG: hypothetical protein NVSMB1_20620 [Polyangiales bacterium]